jgi:hypothetical protein
MDSIPSLGTAPVDATERRPAQSDSSVPAAARQEVWEQTLLARGTPKAQAESPAVHAAGVLTDRAKSRKGKFTESAESANVNETDSVRKSLLFEA